MNTNWTAQETKSRASLPVDEAKARMLDEVRKELPVVLKEADGGVRPFKTVDFQPVRGPGTFEGEFGVKLEDLILHFWPHGYHDAERTGGRTPKFKPGFEEALRSSFKDSFKHFSIEMTFDPEMGAWFMKIPNATSSLHYRDLCVKALEALHLKMGGAF